MLSRGDLMGWSCCFLVVCDFDIIITRKTAILKSKRQKKSEDRKISRTCKIKFYYFSGYSKLLVLGKKSNECHSTEEGLPLRN